jgi:DNA-binding transcriptional regulator YiaG
MAKSLKPIRPARYRNIEELRQAGIVSTETARRVRVAGQRTAVITRLVCQRLSAELSQKDVARRMGRTQSWVSKFEDRTDAELTLGDIQAYCQAIAGSLALEFGRSRPIAA